jgi:translation initiation factor 3 subunit D
VVDPKKGETENQFMKAMVLNEFDPKAFGVDRRCKLEAQRGAVLADELNNNSKKLGRWITRSIPAGADVMEARLS